MPQSGVLSMTASFLVRGHGTRERANPTRTAEPIERSESTRLCAADFGSPEGCTWTVSPAAEERVQAAQKPF